MKKRFSSIVLTFFCLFINGAIGYVSPTTEIETIVTPAATGRQLVRSSLPLPKGLLKEGRTLIAFDGKQEIETSVRTLTWHPSQNSNRFVRRALVTFPYDFINEEPVKFSFRPISHPKQKSKHLPVKVVIEKNAVEIRYHDGFVAKARLIAPANPSTDKAQTDIVESNEYFLWQRTRVPDSHWPRVIEVRADVLGSIVLVAHLQNRVENFGYAPEFGWEVEIDDSDAYLRKDDHNLQVSQKPIIHSFAEGESCSLIFNSNQYQIYHPAAPFKLKGCVEAFADSTNHLYYKYLRSSGTDKVPMQQSAWRRAELVIAPIKLAPLTATLQNPHHVQFEWRLWDELYGTGQPLDLSNQPELESLSVYHHYEILHCMANGDDWGNVTNIQNDNDTGSILGMNRLNHCPAIFYEAMRSGNRRLMDVVLAWCDNFYDLSIWWGSPRTGGTRYNNLLAMGQSPPDSNKSFMWRSNDAVTFCTKGYESFFLAYEQTGDPRMLEALEAQIKYAETYVHTNEGECRNIGDVIDFIRLYRFTGEQRYFNEALRLFRELRTRLGEDNLFSQSGQPIVKNPPFIDDDEFGYKHPFAKPYIIGYALAGLPELAAHVPDEPRLRDVIQAVADFLTESQDPIGGWRYPHPQSSRVLLNYAMEHAWQLVQADEFLGTEESHLDAIENVLRQRIWGWKKAGSILHVLNPWELNTGKVKEPQELYELYRYPEDRDFQRDYVDGRLDYGSCPPEGLVYFPDVLAYYLKHRSASRLLKPPAENEPLDQLLANIDADSSTANGRWRPRLVGVIFNNNDFTDPLIKQRLKRLKLDDLGSNKWNLYQTDYSMRFMGYIKAPYSGDISFSAEADDGVCLVIDTVAVINSLEPKKSGTGKLTMVKGKTYPVTLSYFQTGGTAFMRIYWNWAGKEKSIIPPEAILHTEKNSLDAEAALESVATSSEKVILKVPNPSPEMLPSLHVWQQDKELFVASTFPNIPEFTCDSWCYESPVDLVDAQVLDWGRLQLRHRWQEYPNAFIITTVTPEPGAVEFVARIEVDQTGNGNIPKDPLTPNLCWQLKRAPAFASKPEPYPEFVKRCFIFTDKGLTYLDQTERLKIPSRTDEDPYNNPPWVQWYVGTWQDVPKAKPEDFAACSPTQYTTTVIGAVSRDRKYLAAIASGSAPSMCQAWHDCMHINTQWMPADAPFNQQVWRIKIYVMENNPKALLVRVATDFPETYSQPAMSEFVRKSDIEKDERTTYSKIYQTQGVQDNLPIFTYNLKERLTFPLSWLSGKFSDFGEWREKARQTIRECWLTPPPEAPFDPVIIAEQDRGSYVAKKIVFNITADSRVLGYMLVPKGRGPFPAVLLLHDHGARFDIGKEKVIQPWDVPQERLESAREWVNSCYGGRFIGDELAKRGYVCFCTDALNWGDRGGAGYKGQQALASNLLHLGMSFAGLIAHEDIRTARFLASCPEVDNKRIAAMGLSMGCYRTWQVAAMLDDIAAGVAICWMATVKGLMVPGNNQIRGQSSYSMLHPDLFNHLDYPDVASIACPKPMLFYNGEKDPLFPVASVNEAYEKMRKVWETQNAGDRLVTKLWDVKHVFNEDMQNKAFQWLDEQLK